MLRRYPGRLHEVRHAPLSVRHGQIAEVHSLSQDPAAGAEMAAS